MSRDLIVLKNFDKGIVTRVQQQDIDNDAYVYAKDIDPVTTEGRVRGIEGLGSDLTYGANARISEFIEKDGVYDLIIHDSANNKIKVVVDFYNTNSLRKELDLITSNVSDNSTMLANNREVHIGTGGTSANTAKWIGYCGEQFSNGTSWAISDATNASPIVITYAGGHIVKDGDLVKISGVEGNTAANGIWAVDNASYLAGTFELAGSTGNGAYTTGGTVEQHLCIEDDACINYAFAALDTATFGISVADTVGTAPLYFVTTKTYLWTLTMVYDGYQESPISDDTYIVSDTPAADSEYYTLTIYAQHAGDRLLLHNKRITGVNVYRAEKDADGITSQFQLVANISINDSNWSLSGSDMVIDVIDNGLTADVGVTGTYFPFGAVTIEENSGIPESVIDTSVNYALSAKGAGYAFYGNNHHSKIPDASRYIFKSQYYRYSMVNWAKDFLIMPRPLTALSYYEGRLYAFDLNNVYRINPETLSIEDTMEGIGASGQRSVCVTPYGMFIANDIGAYLFDGTNFTEISAMIKTANFTGTGVSPSSLSWGIFEYNLGTEIIVFHSKEKESVVFMNTYDDSGTYLAYAWVYNIPNRRWLFWDLGEVSVSHGIITGKDGELYLSTSLYTKQMFAGARKLFNFVTKELDMDTPRQIKQFNKIKWDGNLLTVKYDFDAADPTSGTSAVNDSYINQYKKTIQLYVLASSSSSYVDAIEVIFRRMRGKR